MNRRRYVATKKCTAATVCLLTLVVCSSLLTFTVDIAEAESLADQPVIPKILEDVGEDEFHILVPTRTDAEIKRGLEDAHAIVFSADSDVSRTRDLEAQAKAQIGVRKSEIATLKARIKLAKERKREAEKLDLEREKKTAELELIRAESRLKMRSAEKELARAIKSAAETRAQTHERELELAAKRAEFKSLRASAKGSAFVDQLIRFEKEIKNLELKILHGMKELAGKEDEVALRAESVIDSRIDLYEVQVKVRAEAID